METGIKSLAGIKDASIDFVSKRLALEIYGSISIHELNKKIEDIVKKIEPDVKVIFDNHTFKN